MKKKKNYRICGAKTRSGRPCQKPPIDGRNRCKNHGGKALQGKDSPRYKHGFYSKYVSASIAEVLAELEGVGSEELTNSADEIKLMQALIAKSDALKGEISDLKDLETLTRVIDRLVFSKQRTQQIQLQERQLVPVTDVKAFLDFVDETITDLAPDAAIMIMNKLKTFKLS